MKSTPCNQTKAWHYLEQRATQTLGELNLAQLFEENPHRFEHFCAQAPGIFIDLSKQHITQPILQDLLALAQECGLKAKCDAMFRGEVVNATENRQVLHSALRTQQSSAPHHTEVQEVLEQMLTFADRIRADDTITDIVNIGIGGSDLGPRMATLALAPFTQPHKRYHFVSNIDAFELSSVLQHIKPKNTLFVVASKTFTTQETLANAHSAKAWFEAEGGKDLAKHFVALTSNTQAAKAFGIEQTFGFWDWVGGRYSIWSAVGLTLAIAIGRKHFLDFLQGAQHLDEHFAHTPFEKNAPVLLGLMDVWNRNFLHRSSRNIAPYHQGLARFPAYLQQLEMESNGKSVSACGTPLDYKTSGVVWGEAGSNGQHAFFQMLHQGTDVVPVDFILVKKAIYPSSGLPQAVQEKLMQQHTTLLMNGLAQSRALMVGKSYEQALEEIKDHNPSLLPAEAFAHHKTFAGNRPSTTLLLEQLDPYSLGALIALHEQRIFVAGAIWDINSFDQWGVELGKSIAKGLEAQYKQNYFEGLDPSTAGLMQKLR